MRNITLTCTNCNEPSRAVGDPDENDAGHSGSWYCFYCGAAGDFEITLTVTKLDEE